MTLHGNGLLGKSTNLIRAADRLAATPSLVYAAVTAIAFPVTEMLVARREALQYAHDAFDTIVPLNAALARELAQGTASLWSNAITSGNSVLVQGAVPPATPDVWLGLVLSPFAAYFAGVVLLVWVAGFGMHRFLRDAVGLPLAAAYAGGVIYAISFWHVVYGFSVALLPLLLWSTHRLARAGTRWQLPAARVVVIAAVTLWWGHLQVIIFAALCHLAYMAALRWNWASVARTAGTWMVIWLVAGLLFAPVIAAQALALPDSHREIWNLEYLYDGTLGERIDETLRRYRTVALGIPIKDVSLGTATHYGTWFLGGMGLPLLLLSLADRRTNRTARFLLVLLVAIPLIDLAATAVAPHMDALGVFRTFQFVRIRHLLPFALAANAAIGLAVLLRGDPSRLQRLIGITSALVVLALLTWQTIVVIDRLTLEFGAPHQASGWWFGLSAVVLGMAGSALLAAAIVSSGRARVVPALLLVVVLLLVGERALYARHERLVDTGLGTWAEHLDVDPAKAYIADRIGPEDRTLTAGTHPNAMSLAGFHDAAGYLAVYPLGYHAAFGALIDPYLSTDPDRRRYFTEWGNRAYVFGAPVDPEVLDVMGVRWVYSRGIALDGDPSLEGRFQWRNVTVYENTDAFPRAYVVGQAEWHDSLESVAAALADSTRDDLLSTAHLLAAERDAARSLRAADTRGTAEIVAYSDLEIRIRVDASAPGLVVLTDSHSPGWSATVNGEATPVIQTNAAYRGVVVPTGTSVVRLFYQPTLVHVGMVMAVVVAIGLATWMLWYLPRGSRSWEDEDRA